MSIDRDSPNAIRRSEERIVSSGVPVYLSSAPPNGAGGGWTTSYKHLTASGVKPVQPLLVLPLKELG